MLVSYTWRASRFDRTSLDNLVSDFLLDIPICKLIFRCIAFRNHQLQLLRLEFQQVNRDDKTSQLSGAADRLSDNVLHHSNKTWPSLRVANPRTKGKSDSDTVQALDDGQGRIVMCYEDVRAMWHEHFAKIEAAIDTNFLK